MTLEKGRCIRSRDAQKSSLLHGAARWQGNILYKTTGWSAAQGAMPFKLVEDRHTPAVRDRCARAEANGSNNGAWVLARRHKVRLIGRVGRQSSRAWNSRSTRAAPSASTSAGVLDPAVPPSIDKSGCVL